MGSRILIVTSDVLRPQMAGPAARAWHMAQHLASEHDVRLLTTSPFCEISSTRFQIASAGRTLVAEAESWCDVMILQGYVAVQHPVLAGSSKVTVYDVYDPLHMETLASTTEVLPPLRSDQARLAVTVLNHQLRRADFLLCASERQRDFYLGHLAALGRINTTTYDSDPELRSLIDVVPFGVPDHDPVHSQQVLKGVVPGIGLRDQVIVWAGGIYNWLDPITLIRAVPMLITHFPHVRVYFTGLRHPNPSIPVMRTALDAQRVATELSLLNTHVFFNQGWVEYTTRHNYLLEADVGVTCHFSNLETRFAFRTRNLDYLWACLPIVSTEGDAITELMEKESFGVAVPTRDPSALANALARILGDPAFAQHCRVQARTVRERFRWHKVLRPLLQFCSNPHRAVDADTRDVDGIPQLRPHLDPLRMLYRLQQHYNNGGLRQVISKATDKARRLMTERH